VDAAAQPKIDPKVLARLRASAKEALSRCYPRYSGFMVVAAIETTAGKVFGGANVEIVNYSLTKHAEEAAVMAAIAAGAPLNGGPWLRTVYVVGAAPCGSCRQFLAEFAIPGAVVVVDKPYGRVKWKRYLRDLLPLPFGPSELKDRRPGKPPKGLRRRRPA
jgi:cytidine deaminase